MLDTFSSAASCVLLNVVRLRLVFFLKSSSGPGSEHKHKNIKSTDLITSYILIQLYDIQPKGLSSEISKCYFY